MSNENVNRISTECPENFSKIPEIFLIDGFLFLLEDFCEIPRNFGREVDNQEVEILITWAILSW